ncbi:MAG: DegT/DnrJ/EryC1/StrS family aminotransferase [Methylococcaceae bacterium]
MKNRRNQSVVENIPFFGSSRAHIDMVEELQSEVVRVLMSGQSLQGEDVTLFEQDVAKMANRDQAIAVGSATDGLFFALCALGIGSGDAVLVPALSFVASASCIVRSGAEPIFVDVDKSGQIDFSDAKSRITPNTKAILAVHLYGNMLDPKKLVDFAQANKLLILEDAAQAFGASFSGQPAGCLGHASVFSFDPTKVIGAPGTAGAIVVDDNDLGANLRAMRYHGKTSAGFEQLGYNSQMSTLVAATLNLKLEKNAEWTAERQRISAIYDEAFQSLPITLLDSPQQVNNVRHKYTFLTEQRDDLSQHLSRLGVPSRFHYSKILPDESVFNSLITDDYPVARMISAMTISLPIHAYLTDKEVDNIVSAVASFFK